MRLDIARNFPVWKRWSFVRPIQSSQLAQLTIFLPIFGYLIFFNDKITIWLEFKNLSAESSDLILSLRTRLQLLYFGTLAIGLSAIIYRFRCPESIKGFASIKDHRHEVAQRLDASEIVDFYIHLNRSYGFGNFDDTPFSREHLNNFVYKAYNIPHDMVEIIEDDEFWALKTEVVDYTKAVVESHEFISSLLDAKYIYDDISNLGSFGITLVLTTAGLFMISLPSIDLFFSVVRSIQLW